MPMQTVTWEEAAHRLAGGEIGVLPTDTLYGLVGSALKPGVVEHIYHVRRRELDKPMIVLLGEWADLDKLQIGLTDRTQNLLNKVWPGPVSVVVPVPAPELAYLHRGTGSIAFRMPAKPALRELLLSTGPLVAPSANIAGDEPSRTAAEAYGVFGEEAFYLDDGELNNPASALVDARFDPPKILRPAPGFRLQ